MVMMLRLEAMPGATINEAVRESIDIANRVACYVNFDFNGHSVVVSPGEDEDKIVAGFEKRLNRTAMPPPERK